MVITEQRQKFYKEIGLNTSYLKPYYINRAKRLIEALKRYSDTETKEYQNILQDYIQEPKRELKDVVIEFNKKHDVWYNDFAINDTEFDVLYIDADLINEVLNSKERRFREIPIIEPTKNPITY